MKNKIKHVIYAIICVFMTIMLATCASTKKTEKHYSEVEYNSKITNVIDSISRVNSSKKDSINEKEVITIREGYEILVESECDSTKNLTQTMVSGNTSVSLEVINGKLRMKIKQDSSLISHWKSLYQKSEKEKDSILISKNNTESNYVENNLSISEKVRVPWYHQLLNNIWIIISIILFILWILGITPKFIFKRFF